MAHRGVGVAWGGPVRKDCHSMKSTARSLARVGTVLVLAATLSGCITQSLWKYGSTPLKLAKIEGRPEYSPEGILSLSIEKSALPTQITGRLPGKGRWARVVFLEPTESSQLPPGAHPGGELGPTTLSVTLHFGPDVAGTDAAGILCRAQLSWSGTCSSGDPASWGTRYGALFRFDSLEPGDGVHWETRRLLRGTLVSSDEGPGGSAETVQILAPKFAASRSVWSRTWRTALTPASLVLDAGYYTLALFGNTIGPEFIGALLRFAFAGR